MTEIQKKLLKLMKEIDIICRENNIVYYLAGGTAIGALRYKGYIPWDDDADILMTRDNYLKFLNAVKDNLPENRCVECQEFNRNYHNNFARYIDKDSTAIHTNQTIHDDAAGFVIDILVLDPIPYDRKKQWEYIKTMQLYADLINPASRYSFRWQTNMLSYFYERLKIKIFGKDKVLQSLEDKMTKYKEEDCTKYILRWGGVPLISDKDYYGKGRECVFEDTKFIIPEKAEDYLTWHYGDNWMFLPNHAERSTHNAVYCYDTPYDIVKKEAYQYYNLNQLFNIYLRRKVLLFLGMYPWFFYRKIESYRRGKKYNKRFKKLIETKEKEIIKFFNLKEYGKIRKIFKKYIEIQNRRGVTGREDYSGIYRFRHPILIKIPDKYFDIVLTSLIANGDTSLALRFINVKESKTGLNKRENTCKQYILSMQKAISLYASKQYIEAENIVSHLIESDIECISVIKLKIRLLQRKLNDEKEILEWIRKGENLVKRNAISKQKKDGELLKYRADLVTKSNSLKRLALYLDAHDSTNNGIIKLEIRNYFEDHLNDTIGYIVKLSKQGDKKSLYYIEQLCKIVPNNDKLTSLLGKCTLQFMKKPKNIWNIVYHLRKSVEYNVLHEETSNCIKEIVASISNEKIIGDIYYKLIFTSSLEDLKIIETYIEQSIESIEWKLLLKVILTYKQGDTKKAITQAIKLYKRTHNKYIRYLLCLMFRLELKLYSDYIVEKIDGVEEFDIKRRNEYFISRWNSVYINFEEICKMFEDIKVLPKKELKVFFLNNKLNTFEYDFFKKSKEILDSTPFSPTFMLKKLYGINFVYERNGN